MAWDDHWLARDGAYFAHRQIAGNTASILIGDSITEGFWWNTIGPERVINAGYGGISAQQMLLRMPTLNLNSNSKKAIVCLGMNNAIPNLIPSQITQFTSAMNNIVKSLKTRGTSIWIASIPPIEPSRMANPIRSQASINLLNAEIVYKICKSNNVPLINLNVLMDLSTGVAKPGTTRDGIHWTRQTYINVYDIYDNAIN